MKKVLITGSNGLLGQKITDAALADANIAYIATSRGANRHPVKKGYIYIDLDITDFEQTENIVKECSPDVIINTAAMANVDACERDPVASQKVNVEAVANLIALSERFNIHLIHLSTDFVFDGDEGPYMEDDEPNPINVYGKHKLAAEKLIKDSSCIWSIVRTILVYGVVNDLSRTNIVLWSKNALENGQTIKVVNDQWRMPTLAEDLAKACLTMAMKKAEGIYHISGKDLFSICELVDAVVEHWHLESSYICKERSSELKQNALRPKRTGFILDKAYDKLDYVPHSFGEGLKLIEEQLKKIGKQSSL
ncbi:SDR family oxidoreductase [Olivibacter sp. SDN3]|uniref:SDR family oxidoreductase n=1 Tax=Olivibacter sp. SDN3 TaxID=2764720 RepID=UPI0016517123|nr:SDR family oxidoreductase [Olivibacter sp. SDN3]QNL52238.1 SDR family oxidoreductase [Olivibacter sp. SDN3]